MAKQPAFVPVQVPVSFIGVVTVLVPRSVPKPRRAALASKVATARIMTTTDNPDTPEDDARQGYRQKFGLTEAKANTDWDACDCVNVTGQWLSVEVDVGDAD